MTPLASPGLEGDPCPAEGELLTRRSVTGPLALVEEVPGLLGEHLDGLAAGLAREPGHGPEWPLDQHGLPRGLLVPPPLSVHLSPEIGPALVTVFTIGIHLVAGASGAVEDRVHSDHWQGVRLHA